MIAGVHVPELSWTSWKTFWIRIRTEHNIKTLSTCKIRSKVQVAQQPISLRGQKDQWGQTEQGRVKGCCKDTSLTLSLLLALYNSSTFWLEMALLFNSIEILQLLLQSRQTLFTCHLIYAKSFKVSEESCWLCSALLCCNKSDLGELWRLLKVLIPEGVVSARSV